MRGIWQMMGKGKAPSCVRHWPFRLSGWARVGLEGEACGHAPPRKQVHSPMCSLLSLMMLPVKLRRLKYFREGGSAQDQGRTKNRSHDKPNAPPITWLLVLLDAVLHVWPLVEQWAVVSTALLLTFEMSSSVRKGTARGAA